MMEEDYRKLQELQHSLSMYLNPAPSPYEPHRFEEKMHDLMQTDDGQSCPLIRGPRHNMDVDLNHNEQVKMQLLKRPRPLPEFDNDRLHGIYAEWKMKGFYFRDSGRFPRVAIRGKFRVQYDMLIAKGSYPKFTVRIPLVSIGFIEHSGSGVLDVRGCSFRLLICGTEDVEEVKDSLRYLVIRQRIPQAILGKELEWKVKPVRNRKVSRISDCSPLNCFQFV